MQPEPPTLARFELAAHPRVKQTSSGEPRGSTRVWRPGPPASPSWTCIPCCACIAETLFFSYTMLMRPSCRAAAVRYISRFGGCLCRTRSRADKLQTALRGVSNPPWRAARHTTRCLSYPVRPTSWFAKGSAAMATVQSDIFKPTKFGGKYTVSLIPGASTGSHWSLSKAPERLRDSGRLNGLCRRWRRCRGRGICKDHLQGRQRSDRMGASRRDRGLDWR